MESYRIDLRDATSRDAVALAALNVASWRAAYAHMMPEAFLARIDVAAWEERLRARLADAAQFTIVACAGRRRLGFVTAGPIRDEPPARGGEVYALYVDPARTWPRRGQRAARGGGDAACGQRLLAGLTLGVHAQHECAALLRAARLVSRAASLVLATGRPATSTGLLQQAALIRVSAASTIILNRRRRSPP